MTAATTPSTWNDPLPFRCHHHCDHGCAATGRCKHPQVQAPVERARQRGGACGPEAHYMTIKGQLL